MPKRKLSLGETLMSVDVPARRFKDHNVVSNDLDIKVESSEYDSDFDPMQFESTKMVRLSDYVDYVATPETGIDAMKMEYDVKIVNTFRPEMLRNLNELASVTPSNVRIVKKENARETIDTGKTLPSNERKKKQKKKPIKRNKKNNIPEPKRQKSQKKQHIRQIHSKQKRFPCDYCTAQFVNAQGMHL